MQPFRRRLQLRASEDGSFPQWREDEQQQQLTEASSSSLSRKQTITMSRNRHSSSSHQQTWISKLTCVVPRCEQHQQQQTLEFPQHAHSLQASDDDSNDNNKHLFLFPVVLPGPSNVVESMEKTGGSGEDPSEATLSTQSSDKIGDQQLQQSGGDVLQQLAIAAKKDDPAIGDAAANTKVVPKESFSSSSYYLTSSSSDTSGLPWLPGDSTSYTYDDDEKEQVAYVKLPDEEELCIIQSSSEESKSSSPSAASSSLQDETLLGIQPRQQQQQMRAPSRGPDEDDFLAIPGPPSRPPLQPRQRSSSSTTVCTTPQAATSAAAAAAERKPISSSSLPDPLTSRSKQELDWLVEYAFSSNSERYLDYSERLERLEALIRNTGGESDRDYHDDTVIIKNDTSYQVVLETSRKQDHHDADGKDDKPDHAEYLQTTSRSSFCSQDEQAQQMSVDENCALLQAAESVLNASASVLNAALASPTAAENKRSMNDDNSSRSSRLSYDDDDLRETLASARELLASVACQEGVEKSVVRTATEQDGGGGDDDGDDDDDDDDERQELYAKSTSFADTSILAVKSGANNDEDESGQNQSLHEQAKDSFSKEKPRGSKSEKLKALISRFERFSTTGHCSSDETRSMPPTTIETPTRTAQKKKRCAVNVKSELPVSPQRSFPGKEPSTKLSDHVVFSVLAKEPEDLSDSLPPEAIESSPAAAPKGFFWRSHPVHLTESQEEAELVDTSTSTNADDPRGSCEDASSSTTREGHETMNGVEHHSIDKGESRPPIPGLQRYDIRHFI